MTDIFGRVDERKVVRIGAMDYEPLEQVKRLTLDFKIDKRVQEEQLRMQEHQERQEASKKGACSKFQLN